VLRRIFGPQRDEVTGEWRKLHNEELNNLYCSFHENPSSGSQVVPCGQTDRCDKANSHFLEFCELSKKGNVYPRTFHEEEGEVAV